MDSVISLGSSAKTLELIVLVRCTEYTLHVLRKVWESCVYISGMCGREYGCVSGITEGRYLIARYG